MLSLEFFCLHTFVVFININQYTYKYCCLYSGRCPRQHAAFSNGHGAVGRAYGHCDDTPTRAQLLPQWKRRYPRFSFYTFWKQIVAPHWPSEPLAVLHPWPVKAGVPLKPFDLLRAVSLSKVRLYSTSSCILIGCPKGWRVSTYLGYLNISLLKLLDFLSTVLLRKVAPIFFSHELSMARQEASDSRNNRSSIKGPH